MGHSSIVKRGMVGGPRPLHMPRDAPLHRSRQAPAQVLGRRGCLLYPHCLGAPNDWGGGDASAAL